MKKEEATVPLSELRSKAEARKAEQGDEQFEATPEGTQALIHELRTHQIELEMQNEALRAAEAELTEANKTYSSLHDFAPVGYLSLSDKNIILQANLTLTVMLGVDRSALVQQCFSTFIVQEDQDLFYSLRKELLASEQPGAAELRLLRADGGRFWASIEASVVKEEGKELRLVVSDISGRKESEQQLQRFRRLIDESSDAVFVIEPDSARIIDCNQQACSSLGYSRDELLTMCIAEIEGVIPDSSGWHRHVETVKKTGHMMLDGTHRRKVGSSFPVEVGVKYVELKEGSYMIAIARDVTSRKQAEAELVDSHELIRLLLDSTAEAVYAIDISGNCTLVNSSCLRLLNYADESELLGKNTHEMIHHSHADGSPYPEQDCKIFQAIREGKGTHVDDEVFWRKDGGYFPASYWSYPMYRNGQVVGSVVTFLDISEQIRSREALKQNRVQLDSALEGTIAAVAKAVEARDPYTAGHQRRVADLSTAIAGRIGMDAERIKGLRLGASIHDIGKIQLPAEILNRPARLNNIEFQLVKSHSTAGFDILKDIAFPWPVALIAYQHHERINGSGYPQGLKGNDICLEARIVAVADVVEAISSHRPYRAALGTAAALDEIKKGRGTLYDEEVVDICVDLMENQGYLLIEA